MVYTLTLNPAIDYTVFVPNYKDGIVNRTENEQILAGGKGINVSYVLNNLRFETCALGFVAGFTGNMIENMLSSSGIKCDFIRTNEGFSRINVKIKAQTETEINAQGPKITADNLCMLYKKLDNIKDGDFIVLAGSHPKGVPCSIYCDIMEYVKNKDVKIIVDATKSFLTDTLKFKPFLIKPNSFELGEIFGKDLKTDEEIITYALKLKDMGAQNVIVSLGKDGAIMITDNGNILKERAPKGNVINTTGAGDSLVAGFIAGYLEKNDFSYAFKMGICAGSASAFSHNLATKEEIRHIFNNFK
ncbi:MAG: 1-phosphofructokinase [Ruminococcaceae bacterium]|nr:1-phosphofructokinase [Oscillospiraceae bacterium]